MWPIGPDLHIWARFSHLGQICTFGPDFFWARFGFLGQTWFFGPDLVFWAGFGFFGSDLVFRAEFDFLGRIWFFGLDLVFWSGFFFKLNFIIKFIYKVIIKVAQGCCRAPTQTGKKSCVYHANSAKKRAQWCVTKSFLVIFEAKFVRNMNRSCYACATLIGRAFPRSPHLDV